MPEVSVLDRFLARRGDQVRTGDCLEQQQVRGARIVPTGNQAADHAHWPIQHLEAEGGPAARELEVDEVEIQREDLLGQKGTEAQERALQKLRQLM
jgi:hypothetical protein